MDLESHIEKIGRDMVRCNTHCPGIALNHSEGILPRCLYLETEGRASGKGCVIVGVNPGCSKPQEREFYRSNGQTYEQEVIYWKRSIYNHRYYKQLRHFVNELGFNGAILWTELVKCEKVSAKSRLPPLQTFRTCASTYLQKELQEVPKDWILLAVSRASYNALAYMFPSRPVIGVPHPTGSRGGQFDRLFGAGKRLLPEVKAQVESILDGVRGETIWLSINKHAANNRFTATAR
jgi:hypothetical protein